MEFIISETKEPCKQRFESLPHPSYDRRDDFVSKPGMRAWPTKTNAGQEVSAS